MLLYLAILGFSDYLLSKMNSTVTNSQTLLDAIKGTTKEEAMDRCSPSNMSTDENNATENLLELDAIKMLEKAQRIQSRQSLNDSLSDSEDSNTSSKGSIISSNKGTTVGKIDINAEKSTSNRILKRKKRKFDWEVIVVNKEAVKDENGEEKADINESKYKLTVSNFPTHWGENELKEFILKLVCICFSYLSSWSFCLCAENTQLMKILE